MWTLFWLWRASAVSLAPPRPHFGLRSVVAAAVLMSPMWLFTPLLPEASWWSSDSTAEARDTRYPSPASEEALAAQPRLLDDALADLEDQRPGVTDLYFVGFAPDAAEDVFRKDIVAARELFDERFDTDGRSVALINNPRTVLDAPLATVNNLRETLNEIGATIDRDDDVVLVFLESHGSRDYRLTAEFPPLELDELSPQMLREMLDEAGIKWRIVIVSACYSGGYVEPLKDENTLIMTASAANRTSFGCGTDSDATFFARSPIPAGAAFRGFVRQGVRAGAHEHRRAGKEGEGEPAVRPAALRRQRDGGQAAASRGSAARKARRRQHLTADLIDAAHALRSLNAPGRLGRSQGPRARPADRRPVRGQDPGRVRRRGHQDRIARRRRPAAAVAAAAQGDVAVVVRAGAQQEIGHREPARAPKARRSCAGSPARPTS